MKRIWAAAALLAAACILLLLGSLAVFFAFNQLENDLTEAQSLCAQGRYQRAADLTSSRVYFKNYYFCTKYDFPCSLISIWNNIHYFLYI